MLHCVIMVIIERFQFTQQLHTSSYLFPCITPMSVIYIFLFHTYRSLKARRALTLPKDVRLSLFFVWYVFSVVVMKILRNWHLEQQWMKATRWTMSPWTGDFPSCNRKHISLKSLAPLFISSNPSSKTAIREEKMLFTSSDESEKSMGGHPVPFSTGAQYISICVQLLTGIEIYFSKGILVASQGIFDKRQPTHFESLSSEMACSHAS